MHAVVVSEKESAPSPPVRSLAPREHGAYGQLGVPVVAALALDSPGLGALGMAVGAVATFLAHEPMLVLLGQRGRKAREQDGARAAKRLAILGWLAVLCGAAGLVFSPPTARLGALPPLVLATLVVWFVWRKEEKTATGEIVAATALSGAGFPIALAGGVRMEDAALIWLVWTLAFAIATLSVRAVIARAKQLGTRPIVLSYALTIVTAVVTISAAIIGWLPTAVPLALVPFFLLGLGVLMMPVHTKHLRRVGWGLVAASVTTMIIVVTAFHGSERV